MGVRVTATQAQDLLWHTAIEHRALDLPAFPPCETKLDYLNLLQNWLAALKWPCEAPGADTSDVT